MDNFLTDFLLIETETNDTIGRSAKHVNVNKHSSETIHGFFFCSAVRADRVINDDDDVGVADDVEKDDEDKLTKIFRIAIHS